MKKVLLRKCQCSHNKRKRDVSGITPLSVAAHKGVISEIKCLVSFYYGNIGTLLTQLSSYSNSKCYTASIQLYQNNCNVGEKINIK